MTIRQLIRLLLATMAILAGVSAALIFTASSRRRAMVALQEKQFRSYQLADELRHSSDDLTRFARAYVVTGDPKYERYYRDVIGIRDGTLPRPVNYQSVYWDLYVAGDSAPHPSGKAIPLARLMEEAGFTADELRQLRRSLETSDSLVKIEETAIHAVKGLFRDSAGAFTRKGRPDQALAIRIMFGDAYNGEKGRIMAPIDSFLIQVERRSSTDLATFLAETARALVVITSVFGLFLVVVFLSFPVLRARVLSPVRTLQAHTAGVASDLGRLAQVSTEIAHGDLTQSFTTETKPLGSTRPDEVGDLARLHDTMLRQLQETGAAIGSMTAGLHRANSDLHELERLRDDLVNMIVHDMRSPLTVLIASLGLIRMETTGTMSEDIDAAAQGARALNELANTLLDVRRLEEGKMPLTRAAVNLVPLARDVAGGLAALDAGRQIDVHAADVVTANCDAGLVRRVIENLVSNAIKHTPRGGAIGISLTSSPSGIRVAVQDTGAGIPTEARMRIFDKFGAVAARRDNEYHSVGLGLAFCKLAVEAHGGTISVEDAQPRGSVFAFTLPS